MTTFPNQSPSFDEFHRHFLEKHAPKGAYDRDVCISDLQGVLASLENKTISEQIRKERREAVPTDEGAAERLLNRHAREVGALFDKDNMNGVEDLMEMSVRQYLKKVAGVEK